MSRLSITTQSAAQATVERLYKDLERRIVCQPARTVSCGYGGLISENVPRPDLRKVRALPGRTGAAGKTAGSGAGRRGNHGND